MTDIIDADIFDNRNYQPRYEAEESDEIDCECENGLDRDGNICYYCNGEGVVSEREYKHTKELEQQEFNVNLEL
jgi:hypothetical protein